MPRAGTGSSRCEVPEPPALAELRAEVEDQRAGDGPFDYVVENPAGTAAGPWIEAGATWCLSDFGPQPKRSEVEQAIDAGPVI